MAWGFLNLASSLFDYTPPHRALQVLVVADVNSIAMGAAFIPIIILLVLKKLWPSAGTLDDVQIADYEKHAKSIDKMLEEKKSLWQHYQVINSSLLYVD